MQLIFLNLNSKMEPKVAMLMISFGSKLSLVIQIILMIFYAEFLVVKLLKQIKIQIWPMLWQRSEHEVEANG